jgi:4-coumarate--CoA ligase
MTPVVAVAPALPPGTAPGGDAPVAPGPAAAILTAPQVARVLAALLQDEVRQTTGRPVSRSAILAQTRLDEDGLGLDSLARLRAIATVTGFFGLADSGVEDYLVIDPRLSAWTEVVRHHLVLRGALTRLTFTTSGSSGLTPKRATHRLGDLVAEVDAVAQVLDHQSGGIGRVLASVPPHHIYGFLFTVLMPDRQGWAVADLSENPPTAALRQARRGDLVVGTPFTWQTACDGEAQAAGPACGFVSTAPAPPALWPTTRAAGIAHLTEIYGSSETSGIGWRESPDAAFTLLPHLDRCGDEAARDGTCLPLQDRLDWTAPRSFRLAGRLDEAVQVGGTNVTPSAVVRILSGVDGVAEMAVRLDGDRLKAFVVPQASRRADTERLEQALRDAAARLLAPPARPARYTFGAQLPRTAMGKLADWPTADSPTG